jgi:hypothetical protein
MYEGDFVDCAVRRVGPQDDLSRRIVGDLTAMQPRASRLVRAPRFYWLRMWLEGGTGRLAGVPRTTEDVADRIYRMEDDA